MSKNHLHTDKYFPRKEYIYIRDHGIEMSAGYLVRRKILNCNDFNVRMRW